MLLDDLPASDLIRQGMDDLVQSRETIPAHLVKIASARLRRCGISVIVSDEDALTADHQLYAMLGQEHGNEAHTRYNALLRELVSFERALEARFLRSTSV